MKKKKKLLKKRSGPQDDIKYFNHGWHMLLMKHLRTMKTKVNVYSSNQNATKVLSDF